MSAPTNVRVDRGGGSLMLWIDVDPALERETDAWYVGEHLPDRVEHGGYRRARRWVAVDARPRYLTAFDAATPEALASDGYLRLVASISDQSKRIRAGFSNVVRNTFEVRARARIATGGIAAAWRLNARPGADPSIVDALVPTLVDDRVVAADWLGARPDIRAAMDRRRVTGLDDAVVGHVLVVEAGDVADLDAVRARLSDAFWADAGFAVDAVGVYRLMVDFGSP